MTPSRLPESIGRYEVLERLGTGGMGAVFRARDPSIGRTVAIKLLHVDDETMRARFFHEARSVGGLAHRNIVTIHDVGDHDGRPFIVMELIEGRTLADEIQANHDRPLASRLELIEALALALDYAHEQGIVHRDVKPANLMIDRAGVLKILDFGIARAGNAALTQAGALVGTPHYMSPEQIAGAAVDRRSDVFAVGLVMYELLSYRKAFAGDTAPMVMHRILREPAPPLRTLCPWLDADVIEIVERALRKSPAERYQRLSAMAADLERARQRLSGLARLERPTVLLPGALAADDFQPAAPAPAARPRPIPAPFVLRADRLEAHLRAAQAAFDAGDFAAAAEECEQAVPIAPDDQRLFDLLTRATEAIARHQVRQRLEAARQQRPLDRPPARAETSGAEVEPALAPRTDAAVITRYDPSWHPLERPLTRVGMTPAPPVRPLVPPRPTRWPLALLLAAGAIGAGAFGAWRWDGWTVARSIDPSGVEVTAPATTATTTVSVPPPVDPLPAATPPTEAIAPAPPPAEALPPPMTVSEATDLLDRYNAAYGRFDLARLRELYPALPAEHAATLQAEAETTRSCVHSFSNLRISGTRAEPRLEALALKLCAPKELQQEIRERQQHVFVLRRNQDGSLTIVRHSR